MKPAIKREAVRVGDASFPTKKAAMDACRDVLNNYETGAPIENVEHHAFLFGLLERHPEASQKIGVGVVQFRVRATEYGNRCFELVRSDGTCTDFSFKACIDAKRADPMQEVMRACREVVRPQIKAAKDAAFSVGPSIVCSVTGATVTREKAHVDHVPPATFESLVHAFFAGRSMAVDYSLVTDPGDDQLTPRLVDDELACDFYNFHALNATLRVISASANLQAASRHRLRKLNPTTPEVTGE